MKFERIKDQIFQVHVHAEEQVEMRYFFMKLVS